MDDAANNYNPDATVEPENSCSYDLTASVDISQTSFTGVYIAGTFNGWNNASNPMADDDGDGVYSITVSVGAGAQEYKFLGIAIGALQKASTAQSLARLIQQNSSTVSSLLRVLRLLTLFASTRAKHALPEKS